MGRGDKRTKKGKITAGSHGNIRKKTSAIRKAKTVAKKGKKK